MATLPKYHATLEVPQWVALEAILLLMVDNLLWLPCRDRKAIDNPIVKHSLDLWDRVCVKGGLKFAHNTLLQMLNNLSFPLGMDNPHSFRTWREKGLLSLGNRLIWGEDLP